MKKLGRGPLKEYDSGRRYKLVLDVILEFLHQYNDDCFTNPERPNFCVKDFGLEQFQWWVGRKIDETDSHHEDNL